MKFLKLVLSYQEETSLPQWQEYADKSLAEFLAEKMGLDADLRTYITTLTLSLDGQINTKDGLATIHRHLTSMGMFGPGFAAVYPKWGGGSEIAQVACRAGAVGGGIYMLGTGIKEVKGDGSGEEVEVELSDGMVIKTKSLVWGSKEVPAGPATRVSRLIAITGSPLSWLFETTIEGAPTPAVAVVALPTGSVKTDDGIESKYPIHVIAHSSETGECPSGQSILYLSTIASPESKALLESSVTSLLAAIDTEAAPKPRVLYQLYYEQQCNSDAALASDQRILRFPPPPVALTFDDAVLEPVYEAWKSVLGGESTEETLADYMVFADREGVYDDDDYE
ncbi:Rab proteins geranylgeranyltransferase component A [Cytospora mali]|uniref:Rab proteins geranylgeranyltransferase component A n=1 Tax=Cytospora mali TaxID=578113 RepID=A0A194UWR6_CYTMA|nr:Rab proteins geranylgeranyltransferase component A [Valsa mali var. pyri (nom. inval.)]